MNRITLLGRLTADPELKSTPQGVNVTTFTLAVRRDKEKTDFIECVAWRQTADLVCKYFSKGSMIAVDGALYTRNYETKDGQKRKVYEVNVEKVHFVGSNTNNTSNEQPQTPDFADDTEDLPF